MLFDFLQLVYEALRPVNLPFTVLLGCIIIYWLLVVFGLADTDVLDVEGLEADSAGAGDNGEVSGGFFRPIANFLSLGEVPTTVVLSILGCLLWLGALVLNHYFNDGYFWKAGLLFIPNLLVGCLATHLITLPLRKAVRKLNRGIAEEKSLIDQQCVVLSSKVTEEFGQAEIATCGAPLIINVRTTGPEVLVKGDRAVITQENRGSGIYHIKKVTNPVTQENLC